MFKVETLSKYEYLPLSMKNNCFSWTLYFKANYTDETKRVRHDDIKIHCHLKPQRMAISWIDFIFSCYTTHVFECSLDDILSLPLMYKCNSTQRSIFLLSLPLRPLCFILAITLRKKYHVGPSTQSLFSLPVHHRTLDLGGEPQLDQTRQISKAWEWPTCRSLFIWVL